MSTVTINFNQFRDIGVRALSGRDKGEDARRRLKIADYDSDAVDQIIIEIPDDIIQVNSSFFLGLFGDSVRKLGPRFSAKYHIHAVERVVRNFEEAQARALIESASI